MERKQKKKNLNHPFEPEVLANRQFLLFSSLF